MLIVLQILFAMCSYWENRKITIILGLKQHSLVYARPQFHTVIPLLLCSQILVCLCYPTGKTKYHIDTFKSFRKIYALGKHHFIWANAHQFSLHCTLESWPNFNCILWVWLKHCINATLLSIFCYIYIWIGIWYYLCLRGLPNLVKKSNHKKISEKFRWD